MKSLFSSMPKLLLTLLVAGFIPGCGGGGGSNTTAGISGTGITSGPITAFGSIYVNGVRFNIDSANITVDDSNGLSQSDLRKGMQVVVRGDYSGTSGTAVSVEFDELVQGPVADITPADNAGDPNQTRSFTVFGINVSIDRTGTIFEDVTFDTLANTNIVEVSGLIDGSGNIIASYIAKKSVTNEGEIRGTVTNLTGDGFSDGSSFDIASLAITIKSGTVFEDLSGHRVQNGDFVEVRGTITGTNTLNATRIEREDETYGNDGDEVNIRGIISGYTHINSPFKVGSQTVDASSAQLEPASLVLANDLEVEVEGYLSGTTLIADEIESEDGDIEIHAVIDSKTASGIVLDIGDGLLAVVVNGDTQMEDESAAADPDLKFSGLLAGDYVKLNAYQNGANIVASELKRNDADDLKLKGPVDHVSSESSITVLGITFYVDGSTSYTDNNDSPLAGGSSEFFGTDRIGSIVEIQDNAPGNGYADEVELQ